MSSTTTGNVFFRDFISPDANQPDPILPPPTSQINGSASGATDPATTGGANVPTNEVRANNLFPFFDGSTNRLSANPVSADGQTEFILPGGTPTQTPAEDANGNPLTQTNLFPNVVNVTDLTSFTVEDFFTFHSSHQLEIIDRFGTDVGSAGAKRITIVEGTNRFDIVASPDRREVFVLQQLTKSDLAIASLEVEQALAEALNDLPADVRSQIENVLGLVSGAAARLALDNALDGAGPPKGAIRRLEEDLFQVDSGSLNTLNAQISNLEAQVDRLNDQIADLQTALNNTPLIQFIRRRELQDQIDAATAERDNLLPQIDNLRGNIAPLEAARDAADQRRDAAVQVFRDQLENIRTRAAQSEFLSQAEIETRINEIMRRADRANEFFVVIQNPPFNARFGFNQVQNINSLSNNDLSQPLITQGFDNFIAQETRIRDLDNQRLQLAQTGLVNGGRQLDGPNLIALFQLNYNLTREAEVNSETEELNQQNALLRDYAFVQQLVNNALREFSAGEDGADEERTFTGSTSSSQSFSSLPIETRGAISFVEDLLTDPDNIRHPIETLRGINRPTLDIVRNSDGTLNRFSQNALNIFASQLADTVTQINQESQILTNEISNINRERNRHFDLANNSLRRLNDALQTIARI